jgi:intracellular sulfur oxidation DsrE/DsrF family protein
MRTSRVQPADLNKPKRRDEMRGVLFVLALFFSVAAMAGEGVHKIVMHVDENDAARMNLVLNNASNLNKYYLDKGEEAQIEIVTYGPGLTMLNAAKSPVKDRIKSIGQNYDNIQFSACANTMAKIKKKTGKDVKLVPEAVVVPSGVVELVKRQEGGWSYIRP